MGIDMAIPCGLIINELVSNALKHAFPPSRRKKGHIQISMRKNGDTKIELIVGDDGVGIPKGLDFKKTGSLGLQLVNILVEDQLLGKLILDNSKGTRIQINFSN